MPDPELRYLPGYLADETCVLHQSVVAYSAHGIMSPESLAEWRAHLRQRMSYPWAREGIRALRDTIDAIDSPETLDAWLRRAADEWIDPL